MDETTVLIEQLQSGKTEMREVLVEKNLGLVHHIVKRFLGRGVDAEDLFQIGSIGLMKAIDKFDLSFDVKFSTYAVLMISGEIKRFLRDDGMVKVSRTLKENGMHVRKSIERLSQSLGREPTMQELVKETGLEEEDIVLAMESGIEVESIYKSVFQSDGNEIYLVDQVVSANGKGTLGEAVNSPEDHEKEKILNHLLLEQLLDSLKEDEKNLIILRYFKDQTQVEVADRLGISQVQVSRMEKRILRGLREKINA